jgi:hypothetical protein
MIDVIMSVNTISIVDQIHISIRIIPTDYTNSSLVRNKFNLSQLLLLD